jgi:hypothetical protein
MRSGGRGTDRRNHGRAAEGGEVQVRVSAGHLGSRPKRVGRRAPRSEGRASIATSMAEPPKAVRYRCASAHNFKRWRRRPDLNRRWRFCSGARTFLKLRVNHAISRFPNETRAFAPLRRLRHSHDLLPCVHMKVHIVATGLLVECPVDKHF